MERRSRSSRHRDRELSELAALADGSLDDAERARAERRVAGSPELGELVAEQRAAASAVRSAAARVSAPTTLRSRLERQRRVISPRTRRRRLGLAGALAACAATAALLVVAILPGGSPGSPTIVRAATLAARAPSGPPPSPAADPELLDLAGAGIPFPNYARSFGWRPAGVRVDRFEGRTATTAYYAKGAHRIGYTILSGPALHPPPGSHGAVRYGMRLWAYEAGDRTAITWLRSGRTCVLSGVRVPRELLFDLAGWRG